jgi:hypothetical protein
MDVLIARTQQVMYGMNTQILSVYTVMLCSLHVYVYTNAQLYM